jgi:hypothetical protein
LPFTALLANADAATFNLLRRGWFIPSDNIEGIAADYIDGSSSGLAPKKEGDE